MADDCVAAKATGTVQLKMDYISSECYREDRNCLGCLGCKISIEHKVATCHSYKIENNEGSYDWNCMQFIPRALEVRYIDDNYEEHVEECVMLEVDEDLIYKASDDLVRKIVWNPLGSA